jgi:Icc-related predicted phosphoesterase
MMDEHKLELLVGSDLHNSRPGFEWFCQLAEAQHPQLIVFLGDFVNRQPLSFIKEVLVSLRLLAPACFVVPGNWDPRETIFEIDAAAFDGLRNLHRYGAHLAGYSFAGLGGGTTTPVGNTPLESPELGFADPLALLMPADVWLLHNPLHGWRDLAGGKTHVGSTELAKLYTLQEQPPLLVLSGHIHEAAGSEQHGVTTFVNPGSLAARSAARVTLVERSVSVEMLGE